ncbi:hypothetical protein AB4Y32_31780 [Paraburkholderia phymatum]|uniref:Uncharacterized protein n=1 Tax=Paraburkholderia phymatum TaxID=148447 RepID=A0ACC6U9F3_9BURK
MSLLCQYRGDRRIVEALLREFKQTGLSFGARESVDMACTPGFNFQLGDFATSPYNTDCDPVTRDAMQDHLVNKGTQQSLLASRLTSVRCPISGSRAQSARKSF